VEAEMIERLLFKNVLERINRGKIIMMLGARQVGKTTLARQITEKVDLKTLWLNGDEPDVRELLSNVTSSRLKAIIGNHKLLVIDEAQRIANIGITLKLIADNLKNIKVLVTGSSSLELSSLIKEPLTG
jgi:predicted AAA+ superfamily ATPase